MAQSGLTVLKLLQTVFEHADDTYLSKLRGPGGFLCVQINNQQGEQDYISFGFAKEAGPSRKIIWAIGNQSGGRTISPLIGKTVNPYLFVKSYLSKYPSTYIAKVDLVFDGTGDGQIYDLYVAPGKPPRD